MLTPARIAELNRLLIERLSLFMNRCPEAITTKELFDTMRDCSMNEVEAYGVLLLGSLGLYENKEIRRWYLPEMLTFSDPSEYEKDLYYKTVALQNRPERRYGRWTLKTQIIAPCELFAAGDFLCKSDGRIIPRVSFFLREYRFPAVLQDGREWMLLVPNEVETMKKPISAAHGHVLTYGLGLAYFPFSVAQKETVSDVTVVERDPEVITLYREQILPHFGEVGKKIRVVRADAVAFAREQKNKSEKEYDFVLADIWHDPSDGAELYRILKELERKDTDYAYWIEDTIRCYL